MKSITILLALAGVLSLNSCCSSCMGSLLPLGRGHQHPEATSVEVVPGEAASQPRDSRFGPFHSY